MSDFHPRFAQRLFNSVHARFDRSYSHHEWVNFVQPAQLTLVDQRKLTTQLFDLVAQIIEFTHFLRRSFASLGESRVVLAARPASNLTPPTLSRNIQMETAMTGTRRLIPERAQVISAYRMVTHPEEFRHEPHLHDQMRQSWLVLLADRKMRLEAQRAASAIRAAFPEDAA